jgi:hypothetical protein
MSLVTQRMRSSSSALPNVTTEWRPRVPSKFQVVLA